MVSCFFHIYIYVWNVLFHSFWFSRSKINCNIFIYIELETRYFTLQIVRNFRVKKRHVHTSPRNPRKLPHFQRHIARITIPLSGCNIREWRASVWECTQRNLFEILWNQTEIRFYLSSSDWFGTNGRLFGSKSIDVIMLHYNYRIQYNLI